MRAVDIPAEEFAERRRRAAEMAADRGLAGLLVWSVGGTSVDWYGDVMYLTNHHASMPVVPATPRWTAPGHSAVVLAGNGDGVLLTTTLDDPDDRVRIGDARHVTHLPQAAAEAIRNGGLSGERIGLVGRESMLLDSYRALEAALDGAVEFEPADDILERLRYVKSENEIQLVRQAADVGIGWMKASLEAVEPGRTEADIVAEGFRYLVSHGGFPYDVAIASGGNTLHYWGSSGIPHWNSTRPLEEGDLVHCDNWGPVDGYYTDFCRSTVVGRKPTDSQREILDAAVAQIEAIVDEIRPGVTFGHLFDVGARWLEENGFASTSASSEEAGHSFGEMYPAFGHCIGLGLENPHIIEGEETALEANAVVAVETVVGRPQVGAAGFEHNVLVTADSHEILTADCPTRWWD